MAYRNLLWATFLGSVGGYVARIGPSTQSAPATARMPSLARTATLPTRAAAIMADTASDAAQEALCIEDEGIEECTIASWDAGSIKVRDRSALPASSHLGIACSNGQFPIHSGLLWIAQSCSLRSYVHRRSLRSLSTHLSSAPASSPGLPSTSCAVQCRKARAPPAVALATQPPPRPLTTNQVQHHEQEVPERLSHAVDHDRCLAVCRHPVGPPTLGIGHS